MKSKFVFFQALLMVGLATILAVAGHVTTVPAADKSQNVNELNGVGITVLATPKTGAATLSTTVQGNSTNYTGNPQAIPAGDFLLDTVTNVVATVTHIPCTSEKPVTFVVHSQIPTSFTYKTIAPVTTGGYKTSFEVKDQNGVLIENAPTLGIWESFSGTSTITVTGHNTNGPNPETSPGNVAGVGTDANGIIYDVPIGANFDDSGDIHGINPVAVYYQANVSYVLSVSKTYAYLVIGSGTKQYAKSSTVTQTQTTTEQSVYNSGTHTATGSNVSGTVK